jgi:hypothetical protein
MMTTTTMTVMEMMNRVNWYYDAPLLDVDVIRMMAD